MPAATAPALLLFEKNVEESAVALLASLGITAVYERFDEDDAPPANMVVIVASPFERASEHMGLSADTVPVWFFNHFKGNLTYRVTSVRNEAGIAFHRDVISKIRAAHAAEINPFDPSPSLPYQVMRCIESAGTYTYLKNGDRDRSEMVFELEIGIRGDTFTLSVT